ncbi:MAG TPA: hypothetical protein QF517_08025 [Pseudomonadales bacterium]|jgi:hypothetical protein|nr:hypothetical protein [Pseudomonadales bacterium]MDP6315763.1 hypothetical protein [Pseudomonadales bacterium]MDP7315760.1 hypothetical protein [Pseudomonadales bacterium]MDP7577684.1 hypothetical protein [Pseudomonadales bacterium]HJL61889.1 hypothetical protein [Pseudomonadales bacterium]|tara:strand:- start:1881 stop:2519 length:639 start_codon:yes stop_codon:yes gene_type:complete
MSRFLSFLFSIITAIAVSGDAYAETILEKQVIKETLQSTSQEVLLAQPPKDWQLIYQFNNMETRLSDYIPPTEDESDWQTKLSFESHRQLKDLNPISAIMSEIKNRAEICTHLNHFNLFSGFENEYPTSVRLIMCGENAYTSRGEVTLTKAIQGRDYLYLIHLLKKVPVFEADKADFSTDEITEWSTYLKLISLCDKEDSTHPCLPKKSENQ